MFLGYYKFRVKEFIKRRIILFSFRRKGVHIEKDCKIEKNAIIAEGVLIREGAYISGSTVLKSGVRIGKACSLSRISVDKNTTIESGVKCTGEGDGKIVIGKESYIGVNNILDWSDDITIGNFVHIAGPSTGIWTHSSAKQALKGLPLSYKGKEFRPTAPILIEDNVYIGGNCTIYPGVTIGHHAIIAPNSVVNKNIMSYTLSGGVPVVRIKKLHK